MSGQYGIWLKSHACNIRDMTVSTYFQTYIQKKFQVNYIPPAILK